jgi:hypothetical protein
LKRHAAILAVRKDHRCPRGAREIRCPTPFRVKSEECRLRNIALSLSVS